MAKDSTFRSTQQLHRVPPLRSIDLHEINRWVGMHLNRALLSISEKLAKMPGGDVAHTQDIDAGGNQIVNVGEPTSPDHVVTVASFETLLNNALDTTQTNTTSEDASSTISRSGLSTARQRWKALEDSIAEVNAAIPTTAPPKVANASDVGSTTDPLFFALSDHTHQGVNLDATQTVTGLKTFSRAPNPPFAVQAGSDTVVGLQVSSARRAMLAFPLRPVEPAVDFGYRRIFLLMGAH